MRSDSQIRMDVMEELKFEPGIDAAPIGVAFKDGIVTLSSLVSSYAERLEAEDAAKRDYGVRAVINGLEVKLLGSSVRTDVDIAADVVRALKWNVWLPDDRVKVTVSKIEAALKRSAETDARRVSVEVKGGKVILRGSVRSWAERERRNGWRGRRPAFGWWKTKLSSFPDG